MEAIETSFVPLAIHNNKDGEDEKWLEHYDEPAWNNPVVRFFSEQGDELLERKDRVWSQSELCARMVAALKEADVEVPAYLRLALEELAAPELERAVFSMACYWKGEAFFGGLGGVHRTRAGWLEGDEVVEVFYDPRRLPLGDLIQQAQDKSCANRVWVGTQDQLPAARRFAGERVKVDIGGPKDAKTSDRKYHLRRSAVNRLALTPLQATRANSFLERGSDPREVLSPGQRRILKAIQALLVRNPSALYGLERPTDLADLAAYSAKLDRRLAKATR